MAKHRRTESTPYKYRAIVMIVRLQDEKEAQTNE